MLVILSMHCRALLLHLALVIVIKHHLINVLTNIQLYIYYINIAILDQTKMMTVIYLFKYLNNSLTY